VSEKVGKAEELILPEREVSRGRRRSKEGHTSFRACKQARVREGRMHGKEKETRIAD